MTHVLVVDDEAHIRDVVQYALEREGFRVTLVADGASALDRIDSIEPDLVVLDVMMPGLDGLEVCRRIRARRRVPILFLSARSDEIDRVVGLELGGDDYLAKPFSPRELVARVRAILRRSETPPSESKTKRHGALSIDVERHEVRVAGKLVDLTPTELAVLRELYSRPGVVLARSELVRRVHADATHVTERTVDTHVRRIRSKFRELGAADPIATVHGIGYKAAPPGE
jgi:two-component system, OmpR family, response regulator